MTVQVQEVLLLEGVRRNMRTIPDLPPAHARIVEIPHWFVEEGEDGIIESTACWRRYIGTWAIRDDRLYLEEIRGRYRLVGEDAIWAQWFSGTLEVSSDGLMQRAVMGSPDQDLQIHVVKGCVTGVQVVPKAQAALQDDLRSWAELTACEEDEDDLF